VRSSSGSGSTSRILFVDSTRLPVERRRELSREARRRGWELVKLAAGDNYSEVDDAAAELRAEVVAFAGPDGSQAKGAAVASGRELPFACLPTGQNDLFARDLGVDPDDSLGVLAAPEDSCDYYVDLAEVNGVIFVNYAALGLDCTPARVATSVEPRALMFTSTPAYLVAPHQPPARLHWFPGWGRETCGAVFVSNNPRRFESSAVGGRTRLDGGLLGIGILSDTRHQTSALHPETQWRELRAHTFGVDAPAPVRAELDGRRIWLEPPVRFRILPRALRARIPRGG
jgi:diacylglycerol kinase family enzyme